MELRPKSDFAVLCRKYRTQKGLKHREVAAAIDVKEKTYGNVESSPFKVIRRDRAELLANLYDLAVGSPQRTELLDAWERCPYSEFGERRREIWAKRKVLRDRAKHNDRLILAVCEVFNLALISIGDNSPCTCEFGGGSASDPDRPCEVCEALHAIGILEGWTTRDHVTAKLDRIQDAVELKLKLNKDSNAKAKATG